jgi:hypothetical protein
MDRSTLLLSALFLLPVSQALPQSPLDLFSKAPPDVDEALRARVSKFFQAHVDGKPRLAEEVVAEDSKDYFYNNRKQKFLRYEISDLKYSDDFTKAKAIVVVEMYVAMPGFLDRPLKVPLISLWKLENGQWYWYITEDIINTTPFGKVGNPPGVTPSGPAPDVQKGPDVAALQHMVKPDKLGASLRASQHSSDQITLENHMPGPVSLALQLPSISGLEVKLDREQLQAGEKAVISFEFRPGKQAPRTSRVDVLVQPTNTLISLKVNFR